MLYYLSYLREVFKKNLAKGLVRAKRKGAKGIILYYKKNATRHNNYRRYPLTPSYISIQGLKTVF
jgi:hypothetical protein